MSAPNSLCMSYRAVLTNGSLEAAAANDLLAILLEALRRAAVVARTDAMVFAIINDDSDDVKERSNDNRKPSFQDMLQDREAGGRTRKQRYRPPGNPNVRSEREKHTDVTNLTSNQENDFSRMNRRFATF
jgi:hypothetical protein